jgi:hypothetical protein
MNMRRIAIAAAALWLAGCAALAPRPVQAQPGLSAPPPGAAAPGNVRPPAPDAAIAPPSGEATLKIPPLRAAPRIDLPPEPEPDAVIKLDPVTGGLSAGMDGVLAKVAEQAGRDERIIVRLEGYVPAGGSPALSIGICDKVLHKVRERLLALGVSPRRILLANFGGEYGKLRDPLRHWVEVYLLKPGY